MRTFRSAIAISAIALSTLACATQEAVLSPSNVAVASQSSSLGDAEVGKRIAKAAAGRSWTCANAGTNVLNCTLNVRTHQAVIDIKYNNKDYSISYVSSKNLTYKDGTIHRNYNKWIKLLERDINKELSK